MEPSGDRRRLRVMRAWVVSCLVTAFVLGGALPGVAQQELEVTIEAGIDGYVSADRPGVLFVEITSPTLLVGTLETTVGGTTNQAALEVAAGGRKVFEIPFPAPGANATAFVRIIDTEGEEILRQSLPLRAPSDSLLVGVLESPSLVRQLASVRSTPLGLPVEPIAVSHQHLDNRLSAIAYLVAGSGAVEQMDGTQLAAVTEWVEEGGRLIVAPGERDLLPPAPAQLLGEAEVAALERGEIITLQDVDATPNESWATVLRDVPRRPAAFLSFGRGQDSSFQLIEAASSNSGAALPDLSWLLLGLVAYVIAVGPLNLYLLRRLNKTHLTWATVPVLATLTVGLFWLGGPRKSDAAAVLHGSVIVFDGPSSQAQSGVVVVASREGEYTMTFPPDWSAFPVDYGAQFGAGQSQNATTTLTGQGTAISFDLPNLGAGSTKADWVPQGEPFSIEVSSDGNRQLDFSITNLTGEDFWYWGVVYASDGVAGLGSLDATESSGTVSLSVGQNAESFESPILEAFWSRQVFTDGRDEQSIWPLSYAAGGLGIDQTGSSRNAYVFAFTRDYEFEVDVDGTPTTASGPALLIQPVDIPDLALDLGIANAEILAIEGADFVDGSPYQLYIGGAEAVYLSYRIPSGVDVIEFQDVWGGAILQSLSVYDWTAAEFVEADARSVELAPFRGPTGEIIVELTSNEFNEIVPNSIQARWDT